MQLTFDSVRLRSSSESAAMAGPVPHHQQQHHHSTSAGYELAGTPSESCASGGFNGNDIAYNHQQVNNMVQQQPQQHRVSYTGDNPNYR